MRKVMAKVSVDKWLISVCLVFCFSIGVEAGDKEWQRKQVDWQVGSGRRIKAIHFPEGHEPPSHPRRHPKNDTKKANTRREGRVLSALPSPSGVLSSTSAQTIDVNSPPVDGFVPWIAVSITEERSAYLELEAVAENSVTGRYPTGVNPVQDYIIGLYDTGASAHVMGYESAQQAGVRGSLLTGNESIIGGVIGSVSASISYPLGVFIDGLAAIDPDTLLLDRSGMMGQSNVAIMVGQNPGNKPDLPTVIGSPMSVYYTVVIYNDQPITIQRSGEEYTAPDIRLHERDDPAIPTFPNVIPLELRPLGGVSVQYIPSVDWLDDIDDIFGGGGSSLSDFPPASPSVIIGFSSQSLFFVHSVDLYHNGKSAIDKYRFMIDTGAQVTVIGSRIGARLMINPSEPDFEVEIQDVTGAVLMYPGFYVETIEIPALGQWVSFTNVPVILMDVASPEGGTLDGIIGMNLFSDFNLILKGGGLALGDDPSLEFEPITSTDSDPVGN